MLYILKILFNLFGLGLDMPCQTFGRYGLGVRMLYELLEGFHFGTE